MGGLKLFNDGSAQCKKIFGTSPSPIIHQRPDSDLNFLKFLADKEHTLHRLAEEDIHQMGMSPQTCAAVLGLGNVNTRIQRRILLEVLERCMCLLYFNQKHTRVAEATTWDGLLLQ